MKDKVSVRLVGGLANNLFGIACAYAYSLKHDKELVLVNEKFGIVHNSLDIYKDNILSKVNFVEKYDFSGFKIYEEPKFSFDEIPKIEGNVMLLGYFQSELYFFEYEREIRELFSFPEELVNSVKEKYKNVLNKETCSIHVRRTNYLQLSDHHPVQSINYYMKAVREIDKSGDCIFLIFSDDKEWCRNNFPKIEGKFIVVENEFDYEDLLLMSLTKNNIIANSSFSWFGSYLNNNLDKRIIAPSKWFGPAKQNIDTKDLYCKNWIII